MIFYNIYKNKYLMNKIVENQTSYYIILLNEYIISYKYKDTVVQIYSYVCAYLCKE